MSISELQATLIQNLYAGFVDFGAAQFIGDDVEVTAALNQIKETLDALEQSFISTCSCCGRTMEGPARTQGAKGWSISYKCPACGETVIRETPSGASQASRPAQQEQPPLGDREASIILAGLRNLQMDLQRDGAPQVHSLMTDWDTYPVPTLEEIDELCEQINTWSHPCPYCQEDMGAPDLDYDEGGYSVALYTCPVCGAVQQVTNIPPANDEEGVKHA